MRLALLLCIGIGMAACTPREVPVASETPGNRSLAVVEEGEDAPPALTEHDWIVAGVFPGADSSVVRSELGAPREIRSQQGPYGEELVAWKYGDLTVHFNEPHQASAVTIHGRSFETLRSITVGDPMEKVQEAYGPPEDAQGNRWLYCDPQHDECLTLIQFRNDGRQVTEIFLGTPPH